MTCPHEQIDLTAEQHRQSILMGHLYVLNLASVGSRRYTHAPILGNRFGKVSLEAAHIPAIGQSREKRPMLYRMPTRSGALGSLNLASTESGDGGTGGSGWWRRDQRWRDQSRQRNRGPFALRAHDSR